MSAYNLIFRIVLTKLRTKKIGLIWEKDLVLGAFAVKVLVENLVTILVCKQCCWNDNQGMTIQVSLCSGGLYYDNPLLSRGQGQSAYKAGSQHPLLLSTTPESLDHPR